MYCCMQRLKKVTTHKSQGTKLTTMDLTIEAQKQMRTAVLKVCQERKTGLPRRADIMLKAAFVMERV